MATHEFDSALAAVNDWPVPHAAAAVVGPSGVLASIGDCDRVYALASVTKPLTALAALVAVEEEAVTLDDPADPELLPGATLRHLLAHASGVAPERRLRSFEPGVRRVYSNVGFELISELVARGAQMPFSTYFHEALARPMGLKATSLEGSAARAGRSSVTDLARVVSELLNPSRLLDSSTCIQLRSVQYPGLRGVLPGFGVQDPNDWGLGFEIRSNKQPHWTGSRNSSQTYGHFGQSGTLFWIDPVAQVGLVALTDRDFGVWAAQAWPALADAVLTAMHTS